MTKPRVTLDVLGSKMDNLIALVESPVESDERRFQSLHQLLEGLDDRPGLKGRLDRLEQAEGRRTWHIRTLWGAVSTGAVGALLAWFVGR